MKRIILGTAVLLALLTGCTEEKKAPVQAEATQEVKKDEAMPVQVTEEVNKDEVVEQDDKITDEVKDEAAAVEEETIKEGTIKEESK
ncbi:membrane lipoprotein lipid attachment site-containing protein [bacterium]|nr:membrane lipoprotein lipid attachment site-containing protein [bacterium]